jgi:UDP-N-acetylglucosamine 2-epimerase (non-hydrolysing)
MMRIDVVFGTRPELIKLFPVIKLLDRSEFKLRIINTGQHREMLDMLLNWFEVKPDVNLSVMREKNTLASLTGNILTGISAVYQEDRPDLVLVQGDTTTAFASSLAAFYLKIPIGHVEAGLRTFNRQSPWPEEVNRVFITRIADLHFAPTSLNVKHLTGEGVCHKHIFLTGNTVIDALHYSVEKVTEKKIFPASLAAYFEGPLKDKKIVLITGHRRESFGEGFESICLAIRDLALKYPDIHYIYPVHLNPNVQIPVARILGQASLPNVRLINPLTYPEFVSLMKRSNLILTDSGGVQEEAPSLGKPVLVMRENTERPEGVMSGSVRLAGTRRDKIVEEVARLLSDSEAFSAMSSANNPYGDGRAAGRIIEAIRTHRHTREEG